MDLHHGQLVIIEPRPSEMAVIEGETKRLDHVQDGAGVGAQTDDVAGVGGDLRGDQHHVHVHDPTPTTPTENPTRPDRPRQTASATRTDPAGGSCSTLGLWPFLIPS